MASEMALDLKKKTALKTALTLEEKTALKLSNLELFLHLYGSEIHILKVFIENAIKKQKKAPARLEAHGSALRSAWVRA